MSVEVAKDLVARLAVDEGFRSSVEHAGDPGQKRRIIQEAGYGAVSADDLLQVQSAVQQKGMFGDLGAFFGSSLVKAGVDPAGVGEQGGASIGRTIGNVTDMVLGIFL